jgi:hypothetical protein
MNNFFCIACYFLENKILRYYSEKAYSRDVTGREKRKIVTDNRYTWWPQKNSSPICPDLVSAASNDDARNKNASLEVRSVVVLGSWKGSDRGILHPSRL